MLWCRGLLILTTENRSTGFDREEGNDRSPRAGPCLRETRRTEELFESLPHV